MPKQLGQEAIRYLEAANASLHTGLKIESVDWISKGRVEKQFSSLIIRVADDATATRIM